MRDGKTRRVLKTIARMKFLVDVKLTRCIKRLRGEERYRLAGRCCRCGACCETPMIQCHPLLFHSHWMRRALIAWHRHVNGFVYIGEDRPGHTLVFRCTHFDAATRGCDSYETRPGMCRDYPRNLLTCSEPDLLPSCGYKAVDRRAKHMREALAQLDVGPELRRELERRLHLDE